MATIPVYTSREQAIAQAPAVTQRANPAGQTISPNFAQSQLGEQIGQSITELGERMIKVENANARSKANIETQKALIEYEGKVNNDPDLDNALKDYDNYMSKVRDSAAKNFKHKDAREEFIQKFELESIVFRNELDKQIMKKRVDEGRTNTLMEIDLESDNYVNAGLEEDRINSRKKIEDIMNKAVDIGFFSKEEGYKRIEDTIKSANTARQDKEKLRQVEEKQLIKAQKLAITAREQEYYKMRMSGKDINDVPISNEELIKKIRDDVNKENPTVSPKFADSFIKILTSKKTVEAKTKDADFSRIIRLMRTGKENKAEDIVLEVDGLEAEGDLTKDDADILRDYALNIYGADIDDLLSQSKKRGWFGWDEWSKNHTADSEQSRTRMAINYMNKLRAGIDSIVAQKEVVSDEIIQLVPEAVNFPADGKELIDIHGVRKVVKKDSDGYYKVIPSIKKK